MSASSSRRDVEQKLVAAQSGLKSEFPDGTSFEIGGTTYVLSSLLDKLATLEKPFTGAREAHLAFRALVAQRDGVLSEAVAFLAALQACLQGKLGASNVALDKFGFSVHKKPAKLTAEQLLVRAEKAKVTRAKRQTLGGRQQKNLKAQGDPVVTVSPSPLDAPASEPAASSGASSASAPPAAVPPASGGASASSRS